ncbi:hypothetical protein C495_14667 [Natronorubrum sulfidifaciens JCM 14089]|uniref:Uncharacterized protein n=1 Tax=Natronorubrum sulfidifaciens JCM 14089 TaxID=1230460 RepID=L9VZF5_9EURY|nr:hypothetical protein C495_14667 [Natronorubrum sulfidifaciens JCM 14089]
MGTEPLGCRKSWISRRPREQYRYGSGISITNAGERYRVAISQTDFGTHRNSILAVIGLHGALTTLGLCKDEAVSIVHAHGVIRQWVRLMTVPIVACCIDHLLSNITAVIAAGVEVIHYLKYLLHI